MDEQEFVLEQQAQTASKESPKIDYFRLLEENFSGWFQKRRNTNTLSYEPGNPYAYMSTQRYGTISHNEKAGVSQLVRAAIKKENIFLVWNEEKKRLEMVISLESALRKDGYAIIGAAGPDFRNYGYKVLNYIFFKTPHSGPR